MGSDIDGNIIFNDSANDEFYVSYPTKTSRTNNSCSTKTSRSNNSNMELPTRRRCSIHNIRKPKSEEMMDSKEIEKILREIEEINSQARREEDLQKHQREIMKKYERIKNRAIKHPTIIKSRSSVIHDTNQQLAYVEEILKTNMGTEDYLNTAKTTNSYNGPSKPFQSCLNVSKFLPQELNAQIVGEEFIITGKHEERYENNGFISRQFTRKFILAKHYDLSKVDVCLYTNGILEIKIPLKPNRPRPIERKKIY